MLGSCGIVSVIKKHVSMLKQMAMKPLVIFDSGFYFLSKVGYFTAMAPCWSVLSPIGALVLFYTRGPAMGSNNASKVRAFNFCPLGKNPSLNGAV